LIAASSTSRMTSGFPPCATRVRESQSAVARMPLKVSDGQWGERQTFVLKNDETLWHRSWSGRPQNPGSLDQVLTGDSYGFSFVGFSEEVTGKFSMDEFQIRLQPQPKRP